MPMTDAYAAAGTFPIRTRSRGISRRLESGRSERAAEALELLSESTRASST